MLAERLMIHIGTGKDRQSYEFDYGKILNTEAIAMERETGLGYIELVHALPRLSMVAVTAVVWVLRRRVDARLRYEDVQFRVEELEVEELPAPKDDASGTPAKS